MMDFDKFEEDVELLHDVVADLLDDLSDLNEQLAEGVEKL